MRWILLLCLLLYVCSAACFCATGNHPLAVYPSIGVVIMSVWLARGDAEKRDNAMEDW